MKSILVDALRQADGDDKDRALSDSGSYDASNQSFEETANDAVDDGELELMSTTNALIVRDEGEPDHNEAPADEPDATVTIELHYDDGPVDDEHAVTVVGMTPLPVRKHQAPALARYSPALCILLAAVVTGSWLLLQQLGMSRGTGASEVPRSVDEVAAPAGSASEWHRFPFLEDGKPLAIEDIPQ